MKVLQQKVLVLCFDFLSFHPDAERLVEGPDLAHSLCWAAEMFGCQTENSR